MTLLRRLDFDTATTILTTVFASLDYRHFCPWFYQNTDFLVPTKHLDSGTLQTAAALDGGAVARVSFLFD